MKKIAVVIYPYFSLQEITTLTSCFKLWFDKEMDFLGSEIKVYKSEEGFQVTPTKAFNEVNVSDYSCFILPGIINPLPALYDNQVINFLSGLKGRDVLIASISSSPLLLAKAGLLNETKFTAGIFMEMIEVFPFINRENFLHQPLVKDNNIITAIGFAFREFAMLVLNELGLEVDKSFMLPVTREYTEDELTYYFEDNDYQEFLSELKKYQITYRKATIDDVRPALDLALKVFIEFEADEYEPEAVQRFKDDIVYNDIAIQNWEIGKNAMYVACIADKIIGVVGERAGNGHISILFVEGQYHRRGIASELMNYIICDLKMRGFDKITLFSSPYALPFYRKYGFSVTDVVQYKNGFIFTPMEYIPNEIWDILDSNGNKTDRYIERGRKMATGDYHLVVHVWKHNDRGEWLIDRRAMNRGTSIDGKWETTGGAAIAGDDSLTAALRETKEELGIELDPKKGELFHSVARHGNDGHTWIQDAWVFEVDIPIESVHLQESETCEVMWATADKIREMMKTGEFLSEWFYPYFEDMVGK
jgi:4-methyl-5(b-hydroxyethyl)-thiazole monophosphate biosynthesis